MASDKAKLGCRVSAFKCNALDLSPCYGQEQSLFKTVQWKALYKVTNGLFFPLPSLFYISPDSQILVLGSGRPYI